MKKVLPIIFALLFSGAMIAQETITGWTFPVNSGPDSLNANLGTTQNKTYDIRLQMALSPTSDSTINTIFFADGPTTYAAATPNWDNGSESKFWSIKFKANGYSNFKVSSKQKSDPTLGGPKDFKLQWRLSSTTYEDVPDSEITVAGDWTTGVINELPVPITSPGSSSIYIRWIMRSNDDINGDTVAATGVSMIDDIVVIATAPTGNEEIIYNSKLQVIPNPNQGSFTLHSSEPLTQISIIDAGGKVIQIVKAEGTIIKVSVPGAAAGSYFVKAKVKDDDREVVTRLIIQ